MVRSEGHLIVERILRLLPINLVEGIKEEEQQNFVGLIHNGAMGKWDQMIQVARNPWISF